MILAAGGCLLQLVGCAAGFLPVALSLLESAALNLLTSQLIGP